MYEDEPEAAGAVRSFYVGYWLRIRMNLWGEVDERVVPVLLGRFKHEVIICPDGVVVVQHRASTDSFAWRESSRSVLEFVEEILGPTDIWSSLDVAKLIPGEPNDLDFDLDVARTRDAEEGDQGFDRVQLRFVSYDKDYQFWTPANAERLAARNLRGPAQ